MKKLTLIVCLTGLSIAASGQAFTWTENFDAPSYRDSVVTLANGVLGSGFDSCMRIQTTPLYCDTAFISAAGGDTIELRTNVINWMGNTNAILSFDHICKTDFFDIATLEVSINGGASWTQLTTEYITDDLFGGPPNSSSYEAQGWTFNESSWGPAWEPTNPTAVPVNSWWRRDYFDLSAYAQFGLPTMIRWVLYDAGAAGGAGKNGWAIDNILIEVAPCELNPPTVNQVGIIWQNTVYNLGPYDVEVEASDASGIASVWVYWTVNSGPLDSLMMTLTTGINYSAQLPAINDGDTICYYFIATDGTPCGTKTFVPATGCTQFVASAGITYPYCDGFDAQNLWSDSTFFGSDWELGTPAWNVTTGAHSPPNAWDIDLDAAYLGNTQAYLTSPVLGPIAANTKLSFWLNYNMENTFDGMRLETSTNGTVWQTLGDFGNTCACQTNWYTNPNIISGTGPGWSGNSATTGGWTRSEYVFPAAVGPQIQFRFVFTCDASVNLDGVSIDDFCIEEPQPFDAGVSIINQPNASGPAGYCDTVKVTIENFGLNQISNFDVYFSIDSVSNPGATVFGPFNFPGTIMSGMSTAVPFEMPPCFTTPVGAYTICAWTDLAMDGNHLNDTSCVSYTGVPVLIPTACDDMENGNLGFQTSASNPAMIWDIGMPGFGNTSSAHSGVIAWDVNLTTPYLTNQTCTLTTPIYDVTGLINPSFSFWQNRDINVNDGLYLQYSFDGVVWNILWDNNVPAMPGTALNWYTTSNFASNLPGFNGKSNGWEKCSYFIDDILAANPTQQFMQFRFIFRSANSSPLSGVSIDDVCMTQPGPQDAGVILFNTPTAGSFGPVGQMDPVSIVFQNFGSQNITATNIVWAVNGVPMDTTAWTGALGPGSVTLPFSLTGQVTYIAGDFDLCAYTQLIMDSDTTNDTTCITLTGIPVIPLTYTSGYCDDFESGNAGWVVINQGDPNTTWELGAPNYGVTTGAHSGTNAWDVNLNTPYNINANVILLSPYFDFSNAVDTKLSFWRNHDTQVNQDGVRLEYSVNGLPWTVMGGIGVGNPWVNWYNTNLTCNSNMPGWSNLTAGWQESRMDNLGAIGFNGQGSVQFRFVFCSSAFTNLDGFSLDDFCLEVPVPLTAAPVTIRDNAPIPLIFAGQQLVFETYIKNRGTTDLTEVDAQLWIDGTLIGTDPLSPLNPILMTGDSVQHIFSNYPWNAVAGAHDVCVVTADPNDTLDLNPTDDTLCYVVQVIDTINVTQGNFYCNDFDGAQPQWASLNAQSYGPNTSWEIGVPNTPNINTAHTPPNVWATSLTGNYPSLDNSALFTPAFTIDANNLYELDFWHVYNTELYADGGAIDFSTDYGSSWKQLGIFSLGAFWYNAPYVIAFDLPPTPGFSGSVAQWENVLQEICFNPSDAAVIFRFRFQSDFSINLDGWAVDDVCFSDKGVCPVGVEEILAGDKLRLEQNYPNPANGITTIEYYLPTPGNVVFEVTDMVGKQVARAESSRQLAGNHVVSFNTETVRPGVYFYSITYEGQKVVRKMVVTK